MTIQETQALLLADRRSVLIDNSLAYIKGKAAQWYKPYPGLELNDLINDAVLLLLTHRPPLATDHWWTWCDAMVRRAWSKISDREQQRQQLFVREPEEALV